MYDMCGIMLIIGDEPEDADLDDPHIYEPIVDLDSLAKRLLTFQQSYNESIRGAGMDLVFFKVFALTLCWLNSFENMNTSDWILLKNYSHWPNFVYLFLYFFIK